MIAHSSRYVERYCGFDSFHFSHSRWSQTGRLGECPYGGKWLCSNATFRGQNGTIGLYMIWQDCKSALMIVRPETVRSCHDGGGLKMGQNGGERWAVHPENPIGADCRRDEPPIRGSQAS
jgi:hypothetical protein